jgi:hypothetical protein
LASVWKEPTTIGPAARAIASSSIACESASIVLRLSRCGRTGASPEASAPKIDGRSVASSIARARSSAAGTLRPRPRNASTRRSVMTSCGVYTRYPAGVRAGSGKP